MIQPKNTYKSQWYICEALHWSLITALIVIITALYPPSHDSPNPEVRFRPSWRVQTLKARDNHASASLYVSGHSIRHIQSSTSVSPIINAWVQSVTKWMLGITLGGVELKRGFSYDIIMLPGRNVYKYDNEVLIQRKLQVRKLNLTTITWAINWLYCYWG